MTLHYRLNAKMKDPELIEGLVVEDGDIFEECNFSQPQASGAIFPSKKDLVFIRCNTANTKHHPSHRFKQVQSGLYDYCVHLMPNIGLPNEPENCRHVTGELDPEDPTAGRETIVLGKRTDVQLTDEEVTAILAPYNAIRKDRNGWQRGTSG